MGLDAVAPGQPAFIEGVVDELADRVGHPLLVAALVVSAQAGGQRFQRGPERRATLGVENGVDAEHAIAHLADVETAPCEVGLRLVEEAVRVGDMPGVATEVAQVCDRIVARMLQHFILVEEIGLVAELIAKVAEQGGGLVADLAGAQRLGDLGQRLQLLANAEAVGDGGRRHAAEPAEPADHRLVAAGVVIACHLGSARLSCGLAFERINALPQTLGVYPAILATLKLSDRFLEFGEGISPGLQHERSVPNIRLEVNTLTQKTGLCAKDWSPCHNAEVNVRRPTPRRLTFPARDPRATHSWRALATPT
jgi:hypothetical protein